MKKPQIGLMPRSFVFNNPAFPLGVKKITQQGEYDYHQHESYGELVIISRGHAKHLIEESTYPVGPGDVFVIRENRVHAYADVSKDIQINNILFDWENLKLPRFDLETCPGYQFLFKIDPQSTEKDRFTHRFRLNSAQLTAVMSIVDDLNITLTKMTAGYQFKAITLFYRLLDILIEYYDHAKTPTVYDTIPHRLGELVSRMEKDYAQALTVEQMCRLTSMSRAGLFRQFHKYFQDTPLNYLQGIRLEHAAQLLLESEMTVSEIAGLTGFADSSYMARSFRRQNGISPRDFRRKYRQE